MIEHYLPLAKQVHVFTCSEPFDFNELLSFMADFTSTHDVKLPFVFDLRNVDMLKFKAEDFRSHISRFQGSLQAEQKNRCVYLVKDSSAFGMIRMFAAWSSANGLRDEQLVFVCTDTAEASRWLSGSLTATSQKELTDKLTA